MAREKETVYNVQMTEGKNILRQFLGEYDIESFRTFKMPRRICRVEH